MKKYFRMAALLALAAIALPTVAQQSKPLSYSNYLPPTHASNRYALEPLFKTVEQETKGSLKINLYPGGAMVGGKGTISAIRDGLVDGGFIVSLYHQNEIPLNTALSDLAFLVENPLVAMGAVNETVLLGCPECLQEYRKYKTIYMGTYATTPYLMMCKKPVQTLADLKGLKMRAAGTVYGRWASRLGGVPVNITNAEAYEAIERGQLDCMIGALSWLQTLSLWDLTRNVIDLPMGAYLGGALVAFNESSWKSVKESDRATFVKNLPGAMARLAVGYVKDDHDVEAQAKAKGVTIRKPDQALTNLLASYRQDEIRNAIEAAKKRGVRNPEVAVNAFVKNLSKWEAIVARTGNDPVKFEQALRDEIYSKVKF
ncbi:C4-dicarboxylate TRAP transporter substrate-binding protein [Noviherbaspirillum suwonense]|uniref:TRAP-type C4-dicarboxylate transport system, substrate-binding protein n=1 Tax=Noviherbaspirillum suwonense TaxID=1224511 RepID=A0ABY1QR10_9BURK|nr:C4-dicarboxylate TRAP transporter substrate-binding protein [Noviherbaspirillum suwonense]SMP76330.1 TRAP-type C4-dicarboxylate transport system, substrate-binding protein [Noviherbaspirillum suwonense]